MNANQTSCRLLALPCCLAAAFTLWAQPYPLITPQNMDAVVGLVYEQYGSEIQVNPDEMQAFLTGIQTDYSPDLEAPDPIITQNTLDVLEFDWAGPADYQYAAGSMNLATGDQQTVVTPESEYAFTSLAPNDLYLFAFASLWSERQSALWITVGKLGLIIIIDDKIMYTGRECETFKVVATGKNNVMVGILPGSQAFYRIRIDPCPESSVSKDSFIMWMENSGTAISAHLLGVQCPENADNFKTGMAGVSYSSPVAVNLGFAPVSPTTQYTDFTVTNTSLSKGCVHIGVDVCLGEAEQGDGFSGGRQNRSNRPQGIFPNPVVTTATVALDGLKAKDSRVVVSDCFGRAHHLPVLGAGDGPERTIDMTLLAPGVYFLTVLSGNGGETFRIVKVRE